MIRTHRVFFRPNHPQARPDHEAGGPVQHARVWTCLAFLCSFLVAPAQAQINSCAPGTRDYLSLPSLAFDLSHKPDYIPEWQSASKRVDRYGREIAPAANAAGQVVSAKRYSDDLGSSLRSVTASFWRAYDETGAVPDAIKKDYAYFILNVWHHNLDMMGLNKMIMNADAGFMTGTAMVPLPSRWDGIPPGVTDPELLEKAVQADYLVYSRCLPGKGEDDVEGQIEYLLLRRQTLGYWQYVPDQLKAMQLASFSADERRMILDKMIDDRDNATQLYDVSSPSAIRTWLGGSALDRERNAMLQYVEARESDLRFNDHDLPLIASKLGGGQNPAKALRLRMSKHNVDLRAAAQMYYDEFVNRLLNPTQIKYAGRQKVSPAYVLSFMQTPEPYLARFVNPFPLKSDPLDVLNCGLDHTTEAATYLLETYPFAFLKDDDLGLPGTGLPAFNWLYRHDPKVDSIDEEGFTLAYAACALGEPIGAANKLSEIVEGPFAAVHEKRQTYVDQYRPPEAAAYLTPLGAVR